MKKILVAEDDKYLANAYRVKLSKSDFEVKIVSDGAEAIDLLESFTPDILVLDLIMPNKDGFYVLEQMKKNPKWKDIPIVVASNLGQSEDIVRATKLGAQDYIVKTDLTMNKLLEKVREILKKNEAPPTPPGSSAG